MANKTFCPIMTIGFEPPKEGKRDLRLCMKDCEWYDIAEEKCRITTIAENLEYLISAVEGVAYGFEGNYEDAEYYGKGTGKYT